jgi:hypothetical protein
MRPSPDPGRVTTGTVGWWPPNSPTSFIFGPNPPTQPGQSWADVTFKLPPPFTQAGEGCFVQLITANRHIYRNVPPPPPNYYSHFTYQKTGALDSGFPYPYGSGIWNLPGNGQFQDSPTQPLSLNLNDGGGNNWYLSTANDSFQVWAMFKPPSAQGQPTEWIPMALYTWSWNGTAQKQGGQWQLTGAGSASKPAESFVHPEWNSFSPSPFNFWGVP